MFIAIVAAVPSTVTALAGLIVSIRNGKKTDAVAQKTDAVGVQAVEAAEKQVEIHRLVNGNLSQVKADLSAANGEIKALKELVSTMIQAR